MDSGLLSHRLQVRVLQCSQIELLAIPVERFFAMLRFGWSSSEVLLAALPSEIHSNRRSQRNLWQATPP
jgi:hypothetical protein